MFHRRRQGKLGFLQLMLQILCCFDTPFQVSEKHSSVFHVSGAFPFFLQSPQKEAQLPTVFTQPDMWGPIGSWYATQLMPDWAMNVTVGFNASSEMPPEIPPRDIWSPRCPSLQIHFSASGSQECQNPGSTGQAVQSLSAPPQPFMGLFTSIKAVIKVTGQDGGYCCAPITHHISSIFLCQLSNKPWISSLCPAALALFHFLCISTQGDLSEQRGSVSARFTHKDYWWLPWCWICLISTAKVSLQKSRVSHFQ